MRLRGFSLPMAPRLPFGVGALQGIKRECSARTTPRDSHCHGPQLLGIRDCVLCVELPDALAICTKEAAAAADAMALPILEAQAQGGAGRQRPRQAAGSAGGGRRLAILRGRIWPSRSGVRHDVFCLHAVLCRVSNAACMLLCNLTLCRTAGRTSAGWLRSKPGPKVHWMCAAGGCSKGLDPPPAHTGSLTAQSSGFTQPAISVAAWCAHRCGLRPPLPPKNQATRALGPSLFTLTLAVSGFAN